MHDGTKRRVVRKHGFMRACKALAHELREQTGRLASAARESGRRADLNRAPVDEVNKTGTGTGTGTGTIGTQLGQTLLLRLNC